MLNKNTYLSYYALQTSVLCYNTNMQCKIVKKRSKTCLKQIFLVKCLKGFYKAVC